MKKGMGKYFAIVLLALSAFTVNHWLVQEIQENQNPQKGASPQSEFLITQVIDGDTIKLENGDLVRYIGINAPELNPPNASTECFALEAKKENERLVLGKIIKLEKDVSDKDQYGRLLRYVWLDNQMINYQLVEKGFAQIATYPPNVAYQNLFLEAQTSARENNLGLWSKCPN